MKTNLEFLHLHTHTTAPLQILIQDIPKVSGKYIFIELDTCRKCSWRWKQEHLVSKSCTAIVFLEFSWMKFSGRKFSSHMPSWFGLHPVSWCLRAAVHLLCISGLSAKEKADWVPHPPAWLLFLFFSGSLYPVEQFASVLTSPCWKFNTAWKTSLKPCLKNSLSKNRNLFWCEKVEKVRIYFIGSKKKRTE